MNSEYIMLLGAGSGAHRSKLNVKIFFKYYHIVLNPLLSRKIWLIEIWVILITMSAWKKNILKRPNIIKSLVLISLVVITYNWWMAILNGHKEFIKLFCLICQYFWQSKKSKNKLNRFANTYYECKFQ